MKAWVIEKHGGVEGLSLVESRNYVKRILVLAESYRSLYSDLS